MPRKGHVAKQEVAADPVYNSTLVTKFVNTMMWGGKKSTAQSIFYIGRQIELYPCGRIVLIVGARSKWGAPPFTFFVQGGFWVSSTPYSRTLPRGEN